MCFDSHWINFFSAALTPTVAILGVYIAIRQWQTAADKLKFELFHRSLPVYDSARRLLAIVKSYGRVSAAELDTFTSETREAKWLFGDEVANYLRDELRSKALELQQLEGELKDQPIEEERTRICNRQGEVGNWFRDQDDVLDAKFAPFLKLRRQSIAPLSFLHRQ